MVVVDAMEKTAGVRVLQTELNDSPGVCVKLYGPLADIQMATRAAEETAHAMGTAADCARDTGAVAPFASRL